MFRILKKRVNLAVCVVLAVAALAQTAPTHADTAYTNDQIRKLVVLGKMRGHLVASIADWDAAQYDLAMHHSAEIPKELYSIIGADLKKANLADDFLTAANAYAALSMQAGDQQQVHAAYDALIGVIGKADSAFAPAAAFDDPAFRLSVAQGLLAGVEEEYGEGVVDGKLVNPVGYQNAVGFFQIAKEHYAAAQKVTQTQYADLNTTLTSQIAVLEKALPGYTAPDKPVDPKDLETAINTIKAAGSKALNINLENQRSVPEVIAGTRTGLLDAMDAYEKGNAESAYEAAASAYLDNYETLETDLRKKDADLTNLLEKQLVDFGKLIKAGAPLADVKALYAQIDPNLSKAQDLLAAP